MLIGFGGATLLVVVLILFQVPFPHRARDASRLAHLVSELYHRGEQASYANVIYRFGRRDGGRLRLSKVIEKTDSVYLVLSIPADRADPRLANWAGAGVRYSDPTEAARALERVLVETLGVELHRVFLVYYGLSAASDSIGFTRDERYHR